MSIIQTDGTKKTDSIRRFWQESIDVGPHPSIGLWRPEYAAERPTLQLDLSAHYADEQRVFLVMGVIIGAPRFLVPLERLERLPYRDAPTQEVQLIRRMQVIVDEYLATARKLLSQAEPFVECLVSEPGPPDKVCREEAAAPGNRLPDGWIREDGEYGPGFFVCPKHVPGFLAYKERQGR